MKIKKIKQKKYKLLKINLINYKMFQENYGVYNNSINKEDTEYRLKKILNLIYLYHVTNKKILFIGNPLNINNIIKKLLSKTNHIFIPKSTWITGLLTNRKAFFKKDIFKHKTMKLFNTMATRILELKKRSHLIVIIDQNLDAIAIKESYKLNIPVIALNSNLNVFNNKVSYKVPGNFILPKNKLKNNLFYSILISTFKKANFFKQNFKNTLPYKLSTIKKIKEKRNYQKQFFKKKNHHTKKKFFNAFQKKK